MNELESVLFRPPATFLKMYLLNLGFLDGIPGLVICVLSSYHVFVKYAKLWELWLNEAGKTSAG